MDDDGQCKGDTGHEHVPGHGLEEVEDDDEIDLSARAAPELCKVDDSGLGDSSMSPLPPSQLAAAPRPQAAAPLEAAPQGSFLAVVLVAAGGLRICYNVLNDVGEALSHFLND